MTDSIYMAFAVSVLRSALLIGGGWLVQRGLVEDGLMREVAAGLALIVVTQLWGFIRISQRALYEKWVLWLAMAPLACLLYSPLWILYLGLVALYLGAIAAGSAMLARKQSAAVAWRIPLVFFGIHLGFAWGFWKEVGRQVRA